MDEPEEVTYLDEDVPDMGLELEEKLGEDLLAPLADLNPASNAATEAETKMQAEIKQAEHALNYEVKEVKLAKRNLIKVPVRVAFLPNLTDLDLSWNVLNALPGVICTRCTNLEVLKLSYNELEALPEELGQCVKLEYLDVRTNFLHFLPSSFDQLTDLQELFAANNLLEAVPHELIFLQLLHTLDLSHNRIARLGKMVGDISGLQQLSLAHNQLQELPPAIGRLKNLKMLQVSDNFLKKLPNEIRGLSSLEYFDCSNNQLTYLPPVIGDIRELKVLRVNNNKLNFIPPDLCNCMELRELHVRKNKLVNLVGSIHQWGCLVTVDLGENLLQFCPVEIGRLKTLKEVHLDGNPKLRIPAQITDHGSASVIAYLQTIGEQHRLIDAFLERFTFAELSRDELEAAILGEDAEADALAEADAAANGERPPPLAIKDGGAGAPPAEGGDLVPAAANAAAGSLVVSGGVEGAAGAGQLVPAGKEIDRTAIKQEIDKVREHLMANPRLKKLAFDNRKEKQKEMRGMVEQTRRMLAQRELEYGNVFVRQLKRAATTGICNLKTCNLPSVPPEVGELKDALVLDLRDNRIERLSDKVVCLPGLMVLNASYNLLNDMFEHIDLPNVRMINLAFNNLDSLPETMGMIPNLEILYLSNNLLTRVPESFARLEILTDLYLSENMLTEVPLEVCEMLNLQKLSLACNQISVLPPELALLEELLFVDFSFNQLRSVPDAFMALTQLERLNLGYNPFGDTSVDLPEVLCEIPSLVELNMDACGIEAVGMEIGQLSNLEALQLEGNRLDYPFANLYQRDPLLLMYLHNINMVELDLSGIELHRLPPVIGRLTNLKALDLADNNIELLPVEIGNLTNLEYLSLDGNPLKFPFDMIRREPFGDLAAVSFLDPFIAELDLSGCGISLIPQLLYRHARYLQALNLSDNLLPDIPDSFAELDEVKVLVLDSNKLVAFPDAVTQLPRLEVLQMSRNQVRNMYDNVGDLANLQELIMDSNELEELPDAICELATLETLVMPNNSLQRLPLNFGKLKRLKLLDLRCNHLKELPESICMLPVLEILDVRINELTHLPEQLGSCKELRELNLSNNVLRSLPASIGSLPQLEQLRVGANRLTRLPAEVCELQGQLTELQLYGNPLPDVASASNATGAAPVGRLLQLLAYAFNNQDAAATAEGQAQAELSEGNFLGALQHLAIKDHAEDAAPTPPPAAAA